MTSKSAENLEISKFFPEREIGVNHSGNVFLYLKRDESGKCPVIKMNNILIAHFRNKNDSYSIAHDL